MQDLLTELGNKYQTDKATHHQFTPFYSMYFGPIRSEVQNILEIGILNGGSLKMWEEYFPNANIIGIDNQNKKQYESGRIKIFQADQSQPDQLLEVIKQTTNKFDIIIDDGSHLIPHQYITFATLFPYIQYEGYYVLEDLHTSHFPKWKDWTDESVQVSMLDSIVSLKKATSHVPTEFIHQYITQEQADYIKKHTDFVDIFDRNGEFDSITSIIAKK